MFLHPDIIYGPVRSRRLGLSLGINLLPVSRKVCSYECVYCECGWTDRSAKGEFPEVRAVLQELENTLRELCAQEWLPDHITFSGNGEPTMHPAFPEILKQTMVLRNQWTPDTQIAVLTNGVTLAEPAVREALSFADKRIIKMDAGTEKMYRLINIPQSAATLQSVMESIRSLEGHCILQSLFLRGEHDGQSIDNTQSTEITAWLGHISEIQPRSVMIYSLERIPPAKYLCRIPETELETIAGKVRNRGIPCRIY